VKRQSRHYTISDAKKFLRNLLAYGSKTEKFCLLNSNRSENIPADKYSGYDLLAGIGSIEELNIESDSFFSLQKFYEEERDWLFGFFTYDLKNEINKLSSSNFDALNFPLIHFFRPRYVITLQGNDCEIQFDSEHDAKNTIDKLFDEIISGKNHDGSVSDGQIEIKQRISRNEYIEDVKKILAHIQRGDVYELNYCQEFYSEDVVINPVQAYLQLNEFSPMPFSCFYRLGEKYLMCASPERFLKKIGTKIVAQPIKGTLARGKNEADDFLQKEKLLNDEKERAENVMIVDLVRNDLSRTAKKKSVQVEELFGIYSFSNLHQMISTVVSETKDDVNWTDVIRHAFPMGSMTGAPKIRAMQLIEEYEKTKRGLFSGSVGYITPGADFDFNVIIRSMLYNAENKYLSFMAGSAITANSNPEREYEECLLKAAAFFKIFSGEKIEAKSLVNA
jgi:para-aminobenzoate synthetase component 1